MRKHSFQILSILILFFILCFSCGKRQSRFVQRSFYYWKSNFKLQPAETLSLQQLKVEELFVKFFDVTWNEVQQKPEPAATIHFQQAIPAGIKITPVVFITNETLRRLNTSRIDTLAENIIKLLSGITTAQNPPLSNELQLDCDWTTGTKEKYFSLLKAVKNSAYCKGKMLSATIRLHQSKFIGESGIPPVDKGLLMCYNMGDLHRPGISNSILETAELKKYIKQLSVYPLKLDVALPLFDWWAWFRHDQYKGLIHSDEINLAGNSGKKIKFQTDTLINGITFEKGDWIRYEYSPANEIIETGRLLRNKLNNDSIHVILYHLDEKNLSKYSAHELESFFDGLR